MKFTRTQPGLMPSQPWLMAALNSRGRGDVDAQQPMAVGPRAGTAAPRLDAEQVVEQGDHEVVVQQRSP